MSFRLINGDCLQELAKLPENSVDAIVTDPPYGLEFMGKDWDAPWKQGWQSGGSFSKPGIGERQTEWPSFSSTSKFGSANPTCAKCGGRARGAKRCSCEKPEWKPIGKRRNPENEGLPDDVTTSGMANQMRAFQDWCEEWARECLRVLKPGGHMVSFGGSRTYHRMACAIEDAGFEVRDQMMWIYGSGFPKSFNISKALDKQEGMEPVVVGRNPNSREDSKQEDNLYEAGTVGKTAYLTKPASEIAQKWEGWGTALKPSHEPIVLARKPLEGTIADNIRKWGVGGINIDACRVEADGENFDNVKDRKDLIGKCSNHAEGGNAEALDKLKRLGRFPANTMHDGSQEVLDLFPESKGGASPKSANENTTLFEGGWKAIQREERIEWGSGSAARFFYCAKANKRDRNEGCEHLESKPFQTSQPYGEGAEARAEGNAKGNKNNHPTVKPTELMRYLCRLVTPKGGTILDPFNGSGSTGKAAVIEGFGYIGIEREPEYIKIAQARIQAASDK